MRYLQVLFILFYLNIGYSQVPNSSFENWTDEESWEIPIGWNTNNINNFISVTKTTQLTEGNFAMKVVSNGPSFEGLAPGIAQITFLPVSNFNSLQLTYKIDSITPLASAEIIVLQLNNQKFEQIGYWKSDTSSQIIKRLNIPLIPINNDSIRIEVRANSILGTLGFEGYSEITVDDIQLDLVSKVKNFVKPKIVVYPNPSTGIINLKHCNDCIFQVYNLNGQLIKTGRTQNKKISLSKKGFFIVKFSQKDISSSILIQIK